MRGVEPKFRTDLLTKADLVGLDIGTDGLINDIRGLKGFFESRLRAQTWKMSILIVVAVGATRFL
jgi:hypothetical protein